MNISAYSKQFLYDMKEKLILEFDVRHLYKKKPSKLKTISLLIRKLIKVLSSMGLVYYVSEITNYPIKCVQWV